MLEKVFRIDWILLLSTLLLLGVGLIALYSISSADPEAGENIFSRQLIFSAIGIMALIFFTFFDYRYLTSYSVGLYLASAVLLAAVVFWGGTIRGTAGWIGVGSFHIQPVEIAKIILIVFLASFVSSKKTKLGETVRLVASFILSGVLIFLVTQQPDLGSAIILSGIWLGIMVISGINRKNFGILLLVGLLLLSSSWIFLADFQKARIYNFITPEIDPRGTGYNVIQSLVSVGSGGLTGKGIGKGTQSQLSFLPEKHTDFIFATITEELGSLGAIFVLLLFVVFLYRVKKIAQSAQDNKGYLIAVGIMVMIFLQIVINVGMNIGIMPVTGIPLPLLSYGGSSLVTVCAAIGILMNIHRNKESLSKSHSLQSY